MQHLTGIQFGAAANASQAERARQVAQKLYGAEVAEKVNENNSFYHNVSNGSKEAFQAAVQEVHQDNPLLVQRIDEFKRSGSNASQYDAFYLWQFPNEKLAEQGEQLVKDRSKAVRKVSGSQVRRDGSDVLLHLKVPPFVVRLITGITGE